MPCNANPSIACRLGQLPIRRPGGAGAITGDAPYNINIVGTFDMGGSGAVNPAPTTGVSHDPLRRMIIPDCSHLPDHGSEKINSAGVTTIVPGRYSEITVTNPSATVNLNPGMYCVYDHKGFTASGGTINGTDVMIVMEEGDFDLGGSTVVNLVAEDTPDTQLDVNKMDWKGMLVFFHPNNPDDITINGGSGTNYTGTIFAPNALVTVNGGGTLLGVSAQIIGYLVKVTGNADISMAHNEGDNYKLPHAIDLIR